MERIENPCYEISSHWRNRKMNARSSVNRDWLVISSLTHVQKLMQHSSIAGDEIECLKKHLVIKYSSSR